MSGRDEVGWKPMGTSFEHDQPHVDHPNPLERVLLGWGWSREWLSYHPSVAVPGALLLIAGILVGGWKLAEAVASGQAGGNGAEVYRTTIAHTVTVEGKDGKGVVTPLAPPVQVARTVVVHDKTQPVRVTVPGPVRTTTEIRRVNQLVPVVHVQQKQVTRTVLQTQVQTVTASHTETQVVVSPPQTVTVIVTQPVTVTVQGKGEKRGGDNGGHGD
jgi:hypothetical protein